MLILTTSRWPLGFFVVFLGFCPHVYVLLFLKEIKKKSYYITLCNCSFYFIWEYNLHSFECPLQRLQ